MDKSFASCQFELIMSCEIIASQPNEFVLMHFSYFEYGIKQTLKKGIRIHRLRLTIKMHMNKKKYKQIKTILTTKKRKQIAIFFLPLLHLLFAILM